MCVVCGVCKRGGVADDGASPPPTPTKSTTGTEREKSNRLVAMVAAGSSGALQVSEEFDVYPVQNGRRAATADAQPSPVLLDVDSTPIYGMRTQYAFLYTDRLDVCVQVGLDPKAQLVASTLLKR